MSDGFTSDPAVRAGLALGAPAAAQADPASLEFLRAWVSGEHVSVRLREDLWVDPAAWGVALVDIALAAARAHAERKGAPVDQVFARMREGLDAEWAVAAKRISKLAAMDGNEDGCHTPTN
ncbi:MAG TPA: DUF5076 domain-containing protein [Myxococcaceae bacterium]|nr:DUF5076 domain-containing protein [Myxococcaceae bacterium]